MRQKQFLLVYQLTANTKHLIVEKEFSSSKVECEVYSKYAGMNEENCRYPVTRERYQSCTQRILPLKVIVFTIERYLLNIINFGPTSTVEKVLVELLIT